MVGWSMTQAYDDYSRIEADFESALDASPDPRGPDYLYDLVAAMKLPPGATAIDVGCGEGRHSINLSDRFGLAVTGIDPIDHQLRVARAAAGDRPITFVAGTAESIPVPDATVDLVWCRDVLVHVHDLAAAYREFRRVLGPGGRALIYQMVAGPALEPREAQWLWATMFVAPASADPATTEAAISAVGLHVDARIDLSTEWGEWAQEQGGKPGRKLLHAARLLRGRDTFARQYGDDACETMLADCLWHVYAMIGKLTRRAYVLSNLSDPDAVGLCRRGRAG
jgi:SAM-dependent methyltransferase